MILAWLASSKISASPGLLLPEALAQYDQVLLLFSQRDCADDLLLLGVSITWVRALFVRVKSSLHLSIFEKWVLAVLVECRGG